MPNRPPPSPLARPPGPTIPVVALRRGTVAGLAGFGILLGAWAAGATWFALFRDDVVQTVLARQTEQRFAYEDRLADLGARLEREITSHLVERNGFAARADALASRQAEMEARHAWLAALADRLGNRQGGPAVIAPQRPAGSPPLPTTPLPTAGKPVPLPQASSAPPPDFTLRGAADAPNPMPDAAGKPADRLGAVEHSLGAMSRSAAGLADTLRREAQNRTMRLRVALDATRLDLRRLRSPAATTAIGGPFLPVPVGPDASGFAPVASGAADEIAEAERLGEAARLLPLGAPLETEADATSGFGYRIDPFTRTLAQHSGLDFRAEHGAAVRSTASGRVVAADWIGGYGNMVEVEHEGGVSTRYGHLSAITVSPGQTVAAGAVVGRAGSTGRSTGTHLHYEVRIDGEAVNPVRFLEAGRLLRAER